MEKVVASEVVVVRVGRGALRAVLADLAVVLVVSAVAAASRAVSTCHTTFASWR